MRDLSPVNGREPMWRTVVRMRMRPGATSNEIDHSAALVMEIQRDQRIEEQIRKIAKYRGYGVSKLLERCGFSTGLWQFIRKATPQQLDMVAKELGSTRKHLIAA